MLKKLNLLLWIYMAFLFCFSEMLAIYVPKMGLRILYILVCILVIVFCRYYPRRKIDALIFVYFGYMCLRFILQAIFGELTGASTISCLQTVVPVLVYFAAMRLDSNQTCIVERYFCFFCSVSIVLGILNKAFSFLPSIGAFAGGLYASTGSGYVERGYSMAGNALNTGYMSALAIGFLLSQKWGKVKIIRIIMIAVCALGLALSYSRGAMVCALIIIGAYVYRGVKQKEIIITKNKLIIFMAIFLLGCIITIVKFDSISASPIFQRFIKQLMNMGEASNEKRYMFITNAMVAFKQKLFLGYGFGYCGYQATINNVRNVINTESYILSLGIVGGIVAIVLFLAINIYAFKSYKKNGEMHYHAIIAGILVWCFAYIVLDSDITALFYWYCIGRIFKLNTM